MKSWFHNAWRKKENKRSKPDIALANATGIRTSSVDHPTSYDGRRRTVSLQKCTTHRDLQLQSYFTPGSHSTMAPSSDLTERCNATRGPNGIVIHASPGFNDKSSSISPGPPPRPQRPPSLELDMFEPTQDRVVTAIAALPDPSRVTFDAVPKTIALYSAKRPTSPARFLARKSKSVNNLKAQVDSSSYPTQINTKLLKRISGPPKSSKRPAFAPTVPCLARKRLSASCFITEAKTIQLPTGLGRPIQDLSQCDTLDTSQPADSQEFPLSLFPDPPPLVIRQKTPSPLVLKLPSNIATLPSSPTVSSLESSPLTTPTTPRISQVFINSWKPDLYSHLPRPNADLAEIPFPDVLIARGTQKNCLRNCPKHVHNSPHSTRSLSQLEVGAMVSPSSHRTTVSESSAGFPKVLAGKEQCVAADACCPPTSSDPDPARSSPKEARVQWGYAL
ncbi:hypothetical protein AX17_001113 [Amanita inopinata Kibby_2008]|nr:hypothetical protein AX17_001113 [Amanita inopinata Kibby_2008]